MSKRKRDSTYPVAAALFTTMSAQVVGSAAVIAPTVVAPLIATSLGIPPIGVGVYVSLVYLSAMVTSIPSGPIVVALGGTRVAQFCLLVCASGLWLFEVPMLAVAALGALLIGAGYGPLTPASSDVLIRAVPTQRMSLIYSIKQTGVPLGGVAAGALMPGLALAFGWNVALALVGAACALFAIFISGFRRQLDGERTGGVPRAGFESMIGPVRFAISNDSLRTLAIASFVFSATQVSLTAYLVTFLTSGLRWPLVAAGAVLSLSQASGAIGRVLWGWVADTPVGSKNTLLFLSLSMGSSSMSALMLDDASPHWLVGLLMAVFGLTAVGWNGVFLAAVAKLAPSGRAAYVTGGTLAFTYLGVVVGPPIFGAIAAGTGGYRLAFVVLAIPLFLCTLLIRRLPDAVQATAES